MKNKFLKNQVEDIWKENDNLKNQIIALHKALKGYENVMVQQITKIKSDLLIFEDPYHCLTKFIESINQQRALNKNLEQQYRKLQVQFEQLTQKHKSIEQKYHKTEQSNLLYRQQMQGQVKDKNSVIRKMNQRLEELNTVLISLEEEKRKTNNDLNFLQMKMEEDKRQSIAQLTINHRKQITTLRQNIELQAYLTENKLKNQIEKKDTQIRLLVSNMNNHLEKKVLVKQDIQSLQKLMSPFSEHCKLLQTISELRRQISELKNRCSYLHAQKAEIQNRSLKIKSTMQNWKSKFEHKDYEHKQLEQTYNQARKVLNKAEKDIKTIELYYEQKWNNEFESVKNNLAQKHKEKNKILENQFMARNEENNRKIKKWNQEVKAMKDKVQYYQNLIKEKDKEYQKIKQALKNTKQQKKFLQSKAREIEYMNKQQWLSNLAERDLKKRKHQAIIKQSNKHINQLLAQIQSNKTTYQQELLVLRQQHSKFVEQLTSKHKEQIKQLERHNQQTVKQHLLNIKKLEAENQKQKKSITQTNKANMATLKTTLQSQHLTAQSRLQKEIRKFKTKYSQAQLEIQQLKNNHRDQNDQFKKQLKMQQVTINKLRAELEANDLQAKSISTMKQNYEKIIGELNEEVNQVKHQNQSKHVMVESKQTIINKLRADLEQKKTQQQRWAEELVHIRRQLAKDIAELKEMHAKELSIQHQNIYRLEQLLTIRPMSKKDAHRMQRLIQQNCTLTEQLELKQAQKLMLMQIKQYYEGKLKESENKIIVNELKSQKSVLYRPQRKLLHEAMKTHMDEHGIKELQIMAHRKPNTLRRRQNNKSSLI